MCVTMTVLATKKAVKSGALVIGPERKIEANTLAQLQRVTEAVTMARIYLTDDAMTTGAMGVLIGRTEERAAQIIRLGIKYMQEAGWLYSAQKTPLPPTSPKSKRSRCG